MKRIVALERRGGEVIALGDGWEAVLARVTTAGWEWGDLLTDQPMRAHVDALLSSTQTTILLPRTP